MIIISNKLNTYSAGYILILKVGSITPSGVQKHDFMIQGNQDISKTMWGTELKNVKSITALGPLNLVPLRLEGLRLGLEGIE